MPGGSGQSNRLDPGIWKIVAVTVAGAFMAQLSTTMVNVSLSSLRDGAAHQPLLGDPMGDQRLSARAGPDAAADRLAGRSHRGQGALSEVLRGFHAVIRTVRRGLVSELPHRLPCPAGDERMGLLAPMVQMMLARAAGRHMTRVIGYAAVPILLGLAATRPRDCWRLSCSLPLWRWLFLINLPVGALVIVLAIFFLPNDRQETRRRDLDLVGFASCSLPALCSSCMDRSTWASASAK